MKKIMFALVIVLSLMINLYALTNYALMLDKTIIENGQMYNIKKSEDFTEQEHLSIINKSALENNVNVVYRVATIDEEGKYTYSFYSTNNNDFLNNRFINVDKPIFDSGQVYSSLDSEFEVKTSNLYNYTTVENFESAYIYDLNSATYHVFGNDEDISNFFADLTDSEIESGIDQSATGFSNKSILLKIGYILILLILSIFFSVISQKKEINIKRLFGYSKVSIFIDMLKEFVIKVMIILLIIIGLNFFIILILNYSNTIVYMQVVLKYFVIMLILLFAVYIFVSTYVLLSTRSYKDIKTNRELLYALWLIKVLFIILITVLVMSIFSNISNYQNQYQSSLNANENISGYASTNANLSGIDFTPEVQEDVDNKSVELYNETNQHLNGIYIDTRNYRSINNGETVCEEYNQCGIGVNQNYLNTIDLTIVDGSINEEKYNILLPVSYEKTDEALSNVSNYYLVNEEEINIVYYEDNTEFPVYNQYAKTDVPGYLVDPPAYIVPNAVESGSAMEMDVASSVLGGYYMVYVGDSGYNALLPYVKEIDAEGYFRSAPLVSNNFSEQLTYIRNQLYKSIFFLMLNMLLLFVTVMYFIKTYIEFNKVTFSIKFLYGESVLKLISSYLIISIIIDVVIFFLIGGINIYILLIIQLTEFILMIILGKKELRNKILTISKEQDE